MNGPSSETTAQPSETSSQDLAERHEALDKLLGKYSHLHPEKNLPGIGKILSARQVSVQQAKRLKCRCKAVLTQRALGGDQEALAYAAKRKWGIGAEVETAAA